MDKDNDWLKKLLKEEKEIKLRLSKLVTEMAKLINNHDKDLIEHKRWLRQHEVRLGEHWKHISKTK